VPGPHPAYRTRCGHQVDSNKAYTLYSGQTAGKMQLTSKVPKISFLTLPLNRSLPLKNYTSIGPGNQMLLQNLMVDICFDSFAGGDKTTNFYRNFLFIYLFFFF
jgi:hypothetical protein